MRIDKVLLTLTQSKPEVDDALIGILEGIYQSHIKSYEHDDDFEESKTQLIALLNHIISLNVSDFNVFADFRDNVQNLSKGHLSNDIHLTLVQAKKALEASLPFITQNVKKLEKAYLDSFTVTDCFSGAAANITAITESYAAVQLKDSIYIAKNHIVKAIALDYIKKHELLSIEGYDDLIGDEIHFVNGLYNCVAIQYGLCEIADPLIPSSINEHYDNFNAEVENNLTYLTVISKIMAELPLPPEKCQFKEIEDFFQLLGIHSSDIPKFSYKRLYNPPVAVNDQADAEIDFSWTAKSLLNQRYQLLLLDLFYHQNLIDSYEITVDGLCFTRLNDRYIILDKEGEIRDFSDSDLDYLHRNYETLLRISNNDFSLFLQKTSFESSLEFFIRNGEIDLILLNNLWLRNEILLTLNQQSKLVGIISLVSPSDQVSIGHSLAKCIQLGYSLLVEIFIDKGACVSKAMGNDCTSLLFAAYNGQVAVVQALLEKGASVNQAMGNGCTPLYVGAQNGNLAVVQALLKKGASVNQAMEDGSTPLLLAVKNGHVEIIRALLEKGASVNQATGDGYTPLLVAAHNGDVAIVHALLEKGACVDQPMKDGTTALLVAAHNGHMAVVQALLEKGASVNHPLNGYTPLYMAAENGDVAVVRALLEKGASANQAFNGYTPLYIAAQQGFLMVVDSLLDSLFGPKDLMFFPKENPVDNAMLPCKASISILLEEADRRGKKEALVALLKDKQLDLEKDDMLAEFSPLHVAIVFGHQEIVRAIEQKVLGWKSNCCVSIEELKAIFAPLANILSPVARP